MDEFSIFISSSEDVFRGVSAADSTSGSSPPHSSSQGRDVLVARVAYSPPVNEDRIEGYNGYCVIA
ncbi:hypothetical protein BD414DRAFT_582150 [Trametes punicea]|nr:hypothetical protein BD414DRAFT_582150 [Trametes punicea]